MNEFVFNVISGAAGKVSAMKQHTCYEHADVVIVGDDHEIVPLFCCAVYELKKKCEDLNVHYVRDERLKIRKAEEQLPEQCPELTVWESLDQYITEHQTENTGSRRELFFIFANLRSPRYKEENNRNMKQQQLESLADRCAQDINRELLLVTCIPPISEPLPKVLNAVAEREYEVVFRNKPEDSPEKFVCRLEDVIRSRPDVIPRAHAVRLDRVFGPGITSSDGFFMIDILKEMTSTGSVAIADQDRRDYYSASYVTDAMVAILAIKAAGQSGNIYHVSSWVASRFQIICQILNGVPEFPCAPAGKPNGENDGEFRYHMLNAGKLSTLHVKQRRLKTPLSRTLRQTALWYLKTKDYIPKNDLNVYCGRMNRIRELELDLLTEIDRICKEHGIEYFLSAGTMLGAIRHQGFIPWDDDVDIGMLPEEYEKFLKVCPEALDSSRYSYQTYSTEPDSHYIHDKIRINNSWFATQYAHDRTMKNGVYIDIFVYYKTSDKPFFQKLHILHIKVARKLLAIRWATKGRKSRHRRLFKMAYYATRLIPFSWVHWYHRHVIRLYEKRKTHYRLDSTGFNLAKVGAVPDEWFHGTTEATFCGRTFPVLAHYDDYLSHWFGENYMGYPPLSYRSSVHDVKRIDLGRNLFDETRDDPGFHELDLRGELYE